MTYDDARKKFEPKWQTEWEKEKLYEASENSKLPKWYGLIEFPYPSGAGMHVGHIRSNTAMDIITRKRRMEGHNVLYPIGWDAFGLPTENYALKTGISPQEATKQNTDTFRRQLKMLGFGFDWSREINTTDPEYYKWTQWMFLKFFEKGLAYKAKTFINWCPKDKIGLANEEAAGGVCDRCGGPVEKREKEQWMLRITKYADRLLEGLKDVDYIPQAKIQQENWIGRSEGAEIEFQLTANSLKLEAVKVFTTRPDTIFGATHMVVAPEHELVQKYEIRIKNYEEVQRYIAAVMKKNSPEVLFSSSQEHENKNMSGVELKGIKAINPATKEEIPVWVADYVLSTYGTGAIMAVPAHDERDFAFAKKYQLSIKQVICQNYPEPKCPVLDNAYTGDGHLVGSGKFDGLTSEEAKKKITEAVGGKIVIKYKLRDWVFSRQRYWGEPIPLVFCPSCYESDLKANSSQLKANPGWVPVPEKDLPVKLPRVEKYQPTDTGESPLANIESFVNVKCPKCKGPAKRETDTMPNWAGSSWYFLAYCMPELLTRNSKLLTGDEPLSRQWSNVKSQRSLEAWLPVDWYNGGMEHTVLHLLYSRFWNMFLYDLGLVPTSEPYKKRTSHGLVLAEGGVKMSKSKGNVVNPDDLVKEFGADSLRLYEMFMGPFDQAISWDPHGILGCARFLEKIWNIGVARTNADKHADERGVKDTTTLSSYSQVYKDGSSEKVRRLVHRTIKKVSDDIETMSFNTAVSALMILVNELSSVIPAKAGIQEDGSPIKSGMTIGKAEWEMFLKILAPFAPHLTEELYQKLTAKSSQLKAAASIHSQPWPAYNPKLIIEDTFELVIQVNSKIRDKVSAPMNISQADAEKLAQSREETKKWLIATPKKVIYVQNRLINFIV